jgi:hypothetical protein
MSDSPSPAALEQAKSEALEQSISQIQADHAELSVLNSLRMPVSRTGFETFCLATFDPKRWRTCGRPTQIDRGTRQTHQAPLAYETQFSYTAFPR